MPEKPRLDTTQPFTRAAALKAEISAKALRGPRFRQVLHGVYVASSVAPTPELRVRAALLPFDPTAWASHASAARLHGVPIPTIALEHVSVSKRAHRRNRRDIACHLRKEAGEVVMRKGLRVSDYAQMFVELAEILGLVDLVVVGDHLVRKNKITVKKLLAFCEASTLPGAGAARRAASYVRERVDSPMETRLRMLIVLAGLPEPMVNITITDDNDIPIRKYDLSYPKQNIAIEYDGRQHVEIIEQWESDLARREAMDDEDWRILVVISKGIYKVPEETLSRVHRLLLVRKVPGTPARLRDDWRAHFPGRD